MFFGNTVRRTALARLDGNGLTVDDLLQPVAGVENIAAFANAQVAGATVNRRSETRVDVVIAFVADLFRFAVVDGFRELCDRLRQLLVKRTVHESIAGIGLAERTRSQRMRAEHE